MSDAHTVGELDPDTEVCRVRSGAVVHLPDTDCREVARREMVHLSAGVLFGDEASCRYCRGVAGEWHALVVQPRYECPLCGAVVEGAA